MLGFVEQAAAPLIDQWETSQLKHQQNSMQAQPDQTQVAPMSFRQQFENAMAVAITITNNNDKPPNESDPVPVRT